MAFCTVLKVNLPKGRSEKNCILLLPRDKHCAGSYIQGFASPIQRNRDITDNLLFCLIFLVKKRFYFKQNIDKCLIMNKTPFICMINFHISYRLK